MCLDGSTFAGHTRMPVMKKTGAQDSENYGTSLPVGADIWATQILRVQIGRLRNGMTDVVVVY